MSCWLCSCNSGNCFQSVCGLWDWLQWYGCCTASLFFEVDDSAQVFIVASNPALHQEVEGDSMVLSSLPLVFAGFATCHAASITVPSASQLRYQSTDFVALIHFNIETFAHNTGCDSSNWNTLAPYATGKTRDPATFYPKKLNTTQWMESITGLGANIAVLTAKHGCGFTLWPSKAKFLDGRPYNYSVGIQGASIQYDVLRKFVDSAQDAGVGHGFYYSIMKNFYLCHDFNGKHSCLSSVLPGQQNISEEEYLHMAKQQVTELWTQYGNITRIWVDSGLGGLGPLMDQLQPQAAGTPLNPIDWCGTESGYPSRDVGSGEIWSIGHSGETMLVVKLSKYLLNWFT